jgi:soluble lytic murein transglycosylase-like protein
LKEGIVNAADQSVGKINSLIENDINLKEAITDAIKRTPQWLAETATFVLGEAAVTALYSQWKDQQGGRKVSKGFFAAPMVAAMTVAAARNPRAAARLAIRLQQVGVAMPKLAPAGAAVARGAPEAQSSRSEQPAGNQQPSGAQAPQAERKPSPMLPGKPRAGLAPDLRQALTAAAERQQLPPALLHTVARIESGGRPEAVSPRGAVGLMQMMPATARQYGARNIHDTAENINASARYLRHLWRKYDGDLRLILAAYNSGEGAVDRAGRRVPNIAETRAYVQRGMNLLSGRTA